MSDKASAIRSLVEAEVASLARDDVVRAIRELLVEPEEVIRAWDYGDAGQSHVSWTVLKHHPSNTGIAYCDHGFGPRRPWGLVFLGPSQMSLGPDSGWFTTFLHAYFDSMAATELPIWRVYRADVAGNCMAISDEGSWDETWAMIESLRQDHPESKFHCGHDVGIERQ